MPVDNSRRNFFKTSAIAATVGVTSASAASPKNSAREAGVFRYVGDKTKHYIMVIDLRKCVGCQACSAACKVENSAPKHQYRTFVSEFEIGSFPDVKKGFLAQLCNHCEKPYCIPACPVDATFKREDGIVVVDSTTCISCGYCVEACPYDRRFMNTITKVADKCTLCAHRIDDGLLPACVETCVGGARVFGDINDKNSHVSKLLEKFPHNVLKPYQGTNPQTFYISLDNRLEKTYEETPFINKLMNDELKMLEKARSNQAKGVNNAK